MYLVICALSCAVPWQANRRLLALVEPTAAAPVEPSTAAGALKDVRQKEAKAAAAQTEDERQGELAKKPKCIAVTNSAYTECEGFVQSVCKAHSPFDDS